LIVSFVKKISTICLKKQLINICKTRYKYFISGIIYVQNWRVCELLKCILAIQKQPTNRPQLIKSDRPQVNIWDTWKTLKYLNIDDSFHLKDLEISKYKRESKARMPIKCCCLFFVNCGLFSFLNIKKVKIHLLFRIMLLIQWSVIISIFVVHVFIVFGRLTYIPRRLFSEYILTFMVKEPMTIVREI